MQRSVILILFALFPTLYLIGCQRVPPAGSGSPLDSNQQDAQAEQDGQGDGSPGQDDGGESGSGEDPTQNDCAAVDLNGYWDLGNRQSFLIESGSSVTSKYTQEHTCDHRDDEGTSSTTLDDFTGTRDGCFVTGTLMVCRFGTSNPGANGFTEATFTAAIISNDQMDVFWEIGEFSGMNVYRRLPCRPKLPTDWGLSDGRRWTRVTEASGSLFFETLENCNVPAEFSAGSFGTVNFIDQEGALHIQITTDNGEVYGFFTPSPFGTLAVSEGDRVTPSTILGSMLTPCDGLRISPLEDDVNLDCLVP